MLALKIYSEDWEVDARLRPFGVKRAELIEIVRAVVGARSDAVDDDPLSAEGLFAYIFGTRHLRGLFKAKGWLLHREENIESVRHPDSGVKIIYQNVDLAASPHRGPRAISGKGSAANRMIDEAQGRLFFDDELREVIPAELTEINATVWFLCVSVNGDDVRAELSLPASVEDRNFKHFIERIFVVRGGEWAGFDISENPAEDAAEFEPKVTRK
jgi:hypothetical protein